MKLNECEFAVLVQDALKEIPEPIASHLQNVVVDIEQRPDPRICKEMEIDDPGELLGLYQGTPLTEKGVENTYPLPDRIIIFQRNIERMCRTRREIVEQIRTTVLHEVGHYFGLDEDDLDELGYG
jgi:predicted Zn-dependent protease with MMP-like domain